jgi:hypothetical protein
VTPGTIYLHKDFVFADGTTKDKYLVVLGNLNNGIVLVVKTTSQGHRYRNDFGCQSANRFPAFFLPVSSKCFQKNTWICLSEFYELSENNLVQGLATGGIFRIGHLGNTFTRDVQFCAKGSDDISAAQELMIDGSLALP